MVALNVSYTGVLYHPIYYLSLLRYSSTGIYNKC